MRAGGPASVVSDSAAAGGWRRAAALCAIALFGQLCALGMLKSGAWGQGFQPLRELFAGATLYALLGLAAQTAAVAWAARGEWSSLRAALAGFAAKWQFGLIFALTVLGGTLLLRSPLEYALGLILTSWIYAVNLLNLLLAAAAIPAGALQRVAQQIRLKFVVAPENGSETSGWDRALPWLAALWAAAASGALAWLVFERIPHAPDEVAYWFQAKYFASGRLFLPAPPDAEAFDMLWIMNDGSKWYSVFNPGWPAVLALGFLSGAPWLVNPLLAGLTVLLAHALAVRLYTRWLAHVTVLLLGLSPMFLFMSASFFAQPLALVLALAALVAIEQARATRRVRWGWLAGLALGGLVLVHPYEGVLIGLVAELWALGIGTRRLPAPALAGLVLVSVAAGGLLLAYNRLLTGEATLDPRQKYFNEKFYPGSLRLGFGPDIGNLGWGNDALPGHSPLEALINANRNLNLVALELFGWGCGSLGLVLIMLLWGRWARSDGLLLAIIAVVVLGYSLLWYSGADFGARYWYQALVPLAALSARGVQAIGRKLLERGLPADAVIGRLGAFVALAGLTALLAFIPWRSLTKYHHYRGMRPDVRELAEHYKFGHSLVLVQGKVRSDYASAFIFNPPVLSGPGTLYARDLGPEQRDKLQKHFPDRPIWIVAGPSITGGKMQVVAGPSLAEGKGR